MLVRSTIAMLLTLVAAMPAAAEVRSAFAFRLADSGGPLALSWPSLSWDPGAGELYAIDASAGIVDIFNGSGMAVFAFGDDSALGSIEGIAPLANGDLVALSTRGALWSLLRCNFRGEPLGKIALPALPAGFGEFRPTVLRSADDKLYLADLLSLKVLMVAPGGAILAAHDLRALLKLGAKQDGNDMRGFNVGRDGSLLGTVPGLFLAFVISPDGQVRRFGKRGSAPGNFNVVAGIAQDERGNTYVTDALRAVVMVFDEELKFTGEFGYRGPAEDNLISPNEVAAGGGRVFVAQSLGGVKAFDVLFP
jgi:hypothetical protein